MRQARRLNRLIAYAFWFAIGSNCGAIAAPIDASRGPGSSNSDELYSGIECLQRATQILGRPVDMVELLSSIRLQSRLGDTSRELASVANDQRLHAEQFDHLRNEQIAECKYPLLIHVEGGRYSKTPDYYVLYEGTRDGKAALFSPSTGETSIPLSQLEEDRRGETILLSDQPATASRAFGEVRFSLARYGFMFCVIAGPFLLVFGRRGRSSQVNASGPRVNNGTSIFQFACLTVAAVCLAFACRVSAGEPLLPSAPADAANPIDFLLPRSSDSAKSEMKPPKISFETALRLHSIGVQFVDARDEGEFDAGHIAGAILCPAVDIGRWHLHMAGVDPHRKLVVYCAASSCEKGDYVATFLLQNGFTNVCLYRDGWAKWTGPKEGK